MGRVWFRECNFTFSEHAMLCSESVNLHSRCLAVSLRMFWRGQGYIGARPLPCWHRARRPRAMAIAESELGWFATRSGRDRLGWDGAGAGAGPWLCQRQVETGPARISERDFTAPTTRVVSLRPSSIRI